MASFFEELLNAATVVAGGLINQPSSRPGARSSPVYGPPTPRAGTQGSPVYGPPTPSRAPAPRRRSVPSHRAPRPRAPRPSVDLSQFAPEVRPFVPLAQRYGRRYGIPTSVLLGLIEVESGFNAAAVSSADAQGATQFIPDTAESYGVRYGTSQKAIESQVRGAAEYLRDLGFSEDPRLALASYNAGPGNPQAAGDYPEEVLGAAANYTAADRGRVPQAASGPRPRAVRRFIRPTEPPAEIAAELGVPQRRAGISISRLDPALKSSLVQLGRLSGEPVRVNEAFRTRFRQTELAAGRGGATGPAAPPGTSQHEVGEAVDADLSARQRQLLPRVGLGTPVAGEPWHLELLGDSGTSAAPLAGGTLTGAGGGAVEALFGGTGAAPTAGARRRTAPRPRRPVLSPLAAQLAARAPQPRNPLLEDEEEEEPTDLEALLSGQRFRPRRVLR